MEPSNPWAKQFQEAFEHVKNMDFGRGIYDDADGSCYTAITNNELRKRFMDMDVTELSWRWIRAQVPPLGWQQRDEEKSGDEEVTSDEDEPLNYVCKELVSKSDEKMDMHNDKEILMRWACRVRMME